MSIRSSCKEKQLLAIEIFQGNRQAFDSQGKRDGDVYTDAKIQIGTKEGRRVQNCKDAS